ncbi:MAG: cysteine--tRNA ligase [Chloroflexi bacterium 44-23]|nr:MAG: cysteine--tRNA ligase [Chloroflexi bacterium 44-23]
MTIKIYNTLTRKKETFETLEPGKVRLYVCGPTVYSNAHVGHAMSAMVFDIIRRYLEYRGYEVRYLLNFTDVDDKIIARAKQSNQDPFELAETYIHEYEQNLADLNIKPATFNPRATQEISQIIAMISGLIEKGYAYPIDGDVYFRVEKDKDYGRLSGRKLDDMQAGSRIAVDDRKEDPMDFALWKAARPGEPQWESPWGAGRPGWHIECSAMNLHHHGEQIDIHGGGNDLIFPHHENEIAQTESLTGKPFARYWVHNGMLQLHGEKMSKSTGNLITIEEFLTKYSGDTLRYTVLNSSYRSPLTFTEEVLQQSQKALERLQSAFKPASPTAGGVSPADLETLEKQTGATFDHFIASMDDDFNSAGALGGMFDLVRVINQTRSLGATQTQLEPAQRKLRELTDVLGLELLATSSTSNADPFIQLLIDLRNQMRADKQWAYSDMIRDKIKDIGVILEDSKDGTTWHWG